MSTVKEEIATSEMPKPVLWQRSPPRFFGEVPRRGGRQGHVLPKPAGEAPAEAPRFVGE